MRATARAPVTTTIPSAQNAVNLVEVGIRAAGKGRQPGHQEDADRHEQEHPQQVVGGRMIGSLLVAVVEPEELGAHEECRETDREERQLLCERNGVRSALASVQQLDGGDRDDVAEHIRRRAGGGASASPAAAGASSPVCARAARASARRRRVALETRRSAPSSPRRCLPASGHLRLLEHALPAPLVGASSKAWPYPQHRVLTPVAAVEVRGRPSGGRGQGDGIANLTYSTSLLRLGDSVTQVHTGRKCKG